MLNPQDQYTFESKLGFGGQGAVYRAHDTYLDRIVAIKAIPTRVSEEVDDVLREARINSKLKHPNIVDIITVFRENNSTNIVMELLPGSLLDRLRENGPLNLDDAIRMMQGICSAVSHAHTHRIFHRDIKSANILITELNVPKVTDFGISTLISDDSKPMTSRIGTAPYMAPELFSTTGVPATAACDIYALGVLLYEMITGEYPIKRVDDKGWEFAHREVLPVFADTTNLPEDIRAIIVKCLDKNPNHRYKQVDEIYRALEIFETYKLIDLGLGDISNAQKKIEAYTNDLMVNLDTYWTIHYERGLVQAGIGNYQDAIEDFTSCIEVDEMNPAAYLVRGACHGNLQEHHKTIDDCTKVIERDPESSLAYYNRGLGYSSLELYKFSIADFNEAIRLKNDDSAFFSARGTSYAMLGKLQESFADFHRSIQLDPHNALNQWRIGHWYQHSEDYDKALNHYEECLTLDPEFLTGYYNKGLIHSILGDHQTSINDLTHYIQNSADDESDTATLAHAYRLRGLSYSELENHQAAIADYTDGLELNPDNVAEYYYNRGVSYGALNKSDLAINDYSRAIDLNQGFADAFNNRGTQYYDTGDYNKALCDYTENIKINPSFLGYFNRANTYFYGINNLPAAIDDYTRAIEIGPGNAAAYSNRGATHNSMGNHQLAIDDCTQAIQIDREYVAAYNIRGVSHAAMGNHQLAIDDYTQGIRIDPDDAAYYNNRGFSHAAMGNHQMAVDDYTQIIRIHPEIAGAYYNRATSHRKLSNQEQGNADYAEAIRLDPSLAAEEA